MRDIRNDLQERARLIEEQISGAYAQFEKMIEQLQAEREGRVADLKSELGAVVKLLEAEHRRMANVLPIPTSQPMAQQNAAPQSAAPQILQPQISLSEFILRKLNDIGPMSKDDLINFAYKDGLFADAESTERAVHAALISTLGTSRSGSFRTALSLRSRWRKPSGSGARSRVQLGLARPPSRRSSATSLRTFSSA